MDAQGTSEGFVVKVDPTGLSGSVFLEVGEGTSLAWSKTFGSPGKNDLINNLAASKSALYVAGLKAAADGTGDRFLAKLDLNNGSTIWEVSFPDPKPNTEGAFEAIQLTSDGGLITTGLMNGRKEAQRGLSPMHP